VPNHVALQNPKVVIHERVNGARGGFLAGFVDHRFNIIAVEICYKSRVIVRTIFFPQSRCAAICTAVYDCGLIKSIYRSASVCRKGKMKAASKRFYGVGGFPDGEFVFAIFGSIPNEII